MKPQVRNSGNISTGEHHSFEFNLADEAPNKSISIPALGFNQASLSLLTIGATGTSGTAVVEQTVTNGGVQGALPTPVSLILGAGVSLQAFGIAFSGQNLVIDFTPCTFGVVGKIKFDVVLKR